MYNGSLSKNFHLFLSKIVKKFLTKHRELLFLKIEHIQEIQRHQLQMSSLEDKIRTEHPIQFIGAFVEQISLESVGFTIQSVKSERSPSFDIKVFLKIYLYIFSKKLQR
jgi:hypothetical protein